MTEIIKHGLVYHPQLGIGKVEKINSEVATVNFLFAAPSMTMITESLTPVIVPFEKQKEVTELILKLCGEKKRNEKIIKSSNIFKIEWDENNLWVHFDNESVYQYKDVPENVSIKMGEAESAGSFLHQNIKGKYRYERIN